MAPLRLQVPRVPPVAPVQATTKEPMTKQFKPIRGQCEAALIYTTYARARAVSRFRRGHRCPENGMLRDSGHVLCWVHASAVAHGTRKVHFREVHP